MFLGRECLLCPQFDKSQLGHVKVRDNRDMVAIANQMPLSVQQRVGCVLGPRVERYLLRTPLIAPASSDNTSACWASVRCVRGVECVATLAYRKRVG